MVVSRIFQLLMAEVTRDQPVQALSGSVERRVLPRSTMRTKKSSGQTARDRKSGRQMVVPGSPNPRSRLSSARSRASGLLKDSRQLGVGVSCGPEILAHIARIAYEAGFIITSEDAVNAFNEISRDAMLRKNAEIWPEAYEFFYLHYLLDLICVF